MPPMRELVPSPRSHSARRRVSSSTCSLNEAVEVNFGSKPFAFDVDGLLRQERDQQATAIAA